MERTRVWLDQDLCTGCGNCGEVAPDIFLLNSDGVSAVHLEGQEMQIDRLSGRYITEEELGVARRAANECPGEIIYLENLHPPK